ncbi:MAG: H/ACA ribonucleoprotein complex subunit NOP10 [Candidatus Woesearchaeota archaeon]
MARHIRFCESCKKYTLKETCDGKETIIPEPPKYSPEDKYGRFRRTAKREQYEARGLL